MSEVSDLFDRETMAELRALRKDRKLVIGVGCRPYGLRDEETGVLLNDLVVCVELPSLAMRSHGPMGDAPRDDALIGALILAMLDPDEGEPRLPRRIVIEEQGLAREIRPVLNRLGVEVAVAPIPELDSAAVAVRESMEALPKWTRGTRGMLPVYQAAASLWAAEPWALLPAENVSAQITIDLADGRRDFFVIAAQAPDEGCFAAFLFSWDDLEAALSDLDAFLPTLIGTEDFEASVDSADGLWIAFLTDDDLPDEILDGIQERRMPLGSGNAYPLFIRTRRGQTSCPPDDADAELLVAAMEALARFCLRNRVRIADQERPVVDEVMVPVGDRMAQARVVAPVSPPV